MSLILLLGVRAQKGASEGGTRRRKAFYRPSRAEFIRLYGVESRHWMPTFAGMTATGHSRASGNPGAVQAIANRSRGYSLIWNGMLASESGSLIALRTHMGSRPLKPSASTVILIWPALSARRPRTLNVL